MDEGIPQDNADIAVDGLQQYLTNQMSQGARWTSMEDLLDDGIAEGYTFEPEPWEVPSGFTGNTREYEDPLDPRNWPTTNPAWFGSEMGRETLEKVSEQNGPDWVEIGNLIFVPEVDFVDGDPLGIEYDDDEEMATELSRLDIPFNFEDPPYNKFEDPDYVDEWDDPNFLPRRSLALDIYRPGTMVPSGYFSQYGMGGGPGTRSTYNWDTNMTYG